MSKLEREVSCHTTHALLEYARRKNIVIDSSRLADPVSLLDNPREWTFAPVWTEIAHQIETALGGEPDAIITITEDIFARETGFIFALLLRLLPPQSIFNTVTKLTRNYSNRNLEIHLEPSGKNRWIYRVWRTSPGHFSQQMCDYNRGAARAILKLKGYTNISFDEVSCIPRNGATECNYTIEALPPASLFDKLRNSFRFFMRDRHAVVSHLEENHRVLQQQYQEILSMRDFYSHIMKNINEAILWLDKEGIVTFANASFAQFVPLTTGDCTGQRFEKFLLHDFQSSQFKLMCSDAQHSPGSVIAAEFFFASSKGGMQIGHTTLQWISSEHRSPGYLVTIRDITEKRAIERQLTAAEGRYRSLYENSPAIIIALDMAGIFLYANPAMVEQSGYSEEELQSMHFRQLIAPNAEFEVDHLISTLLSTPTRLQEVHFKTKSGIWKCVALNTYHITDSNNSVLGIAGIGIDLTETKKLNEQIIKTQRMDLLGQLAGGLAHDFGNIITSINGFSRLIATRTEDEKIKHYAESIERSGYRAYELVKNLLAFSRNEVAQNVKFDVVSIAGEVADILTGAVSSNITITSDLPEFQLVVKGDPGKIHQCILNLCINARDAIGTKKDGTILIRAKKAGDNLSRIFIEVEDNGSGIPPDIIDKIFDPFFSTKEKKAGTGLGLSVVYGIMKTHQGEIHIDTRPGEGTTFTLDLPAAG